MKRIYGVPVWLMKKYLADLGGSEANNGLMVGDGWQALIKKSEPARIGSLVVGRIEVEFAGAEQTLEELLERLHWKTMRGGG